MNFLRKLSFVLLVVYLGLAVGAFFHTHGPGGQHAANCQLCQITHAPQDAVATVDLAPEHHDFGNVAADFVFDSGSEFAIRLCGRAPPRS